MKRFFLFPFFCCLFFVPAAQLPADSISAAQAKEIMHYLASDSLEGRGNFTPHLHKAASFIAGWFRQAGLKYLSGMDGYYHFFATKNTRGPVKDSTGKYIPENTLLNVIGVMDGKSKPDEVVMFCAHYDHMGREGMVYNGANDNASGTTALLLLADYFARRGDNERTILFCAFAGEELGLLGSTKLSKLLRPESIVAVINIEMIGIPQVGKNTFFITGSDRSNLEKIFKKALPKMYKIRNEPSYQKELFSRSDNYPFAQQGIPAHTIMASDDDDRCYHQPCDDVGRTDIDNMTNLVRAIALGSEKIISGQETPSRIY